MIKCQDYKYQAVSLVHPLKVANVVVLDTTVVLAPIFALVPVVHLLLPGSLALSCVLRLRWAPVGWSSPCSGPTPLPSGVRKGLSLFGRLGFGRSQR
jgi:hypothetical protein